MLVAKTIACYVGASVLNEKFYYVDTRPIRLKERQTGSGLKLRDSSQSTRSDSIKFTSLNIFC